VCRCAYDIERSMDARAAHKRPVVLSGEGGRTHRWGYGASPRTDRLDAQAQAAAGPSKRYAPTEAHRECQTQRKREREREREKDTHRITMWVDG
jgi:hypothetical protein